jgi:hypothetical protein
MPNLQFNEKLELQKKKNTHTHTLSHRMFGLHNGKDVHRVLMCMYRSKNMD